MFPQRGGPLRFFVDTDAASSIAATGGITCVDVGVYPSIEGIADALFLIWWRRMRAQGPEAA